MDKCGCEPFQSCHCCSTSFPKPGVKKKKKNTQKEVGRKLTIPNDQRCRFLGYQTGTECYRHAESSIIKYLDGGGVMGSRINDNLTAWLSDTADKLLSKPVPKDASDAEHEKHALAWAILIIKTHLL